MPVHLAAYAALAALLTVTPGADTALVTRATLAHGRRAAFFTTLGVSSGLFVHAAASALGLSLLLATSAQAYTALKLAGAAYLVWLGARTLWDARRAADDITMISTPSPGPWASYRQGLLSNVLNPKVAVFYLTFLPQFLAPGDPVLLASLALAGIHVAMGLAWLTAYAAALDRVGRALWGPRVKAWMARVTGGVLVAFGVRLALSQAPARA